MGKGRGRVGEVNHMVMDRHWTFGGEYTIVYKDIKL